MSTVTPTAQAPNASDGLGEYRKPCSRCKIEQPLTSFYEYTGRGGVRRRMAKCKTCHGAVAQDWNRRNPLRAATADAAYKSSARGRRRRRLTLYGMTEEQLAGMEAEQAGRCAICGTDVGDALVVDHDHATGAVRALLCTPCNVGLGGFADDPQRLLAAAAYLVAHAERVAP